MKNLSHKYFSTNSKNNIIEQSSKNINNSKKSTSLKIITYKKIIKSPTLRNYNKNISSKISIPQRQAFSPKIKRIKSKVNSLENIGRFESNESNKNLKVFQRNRSVYIGQRNERCFSSQFPETLDINSNKDIRHIPKRKLHGSSSTNYYFKTNHDLIHINKETMSSGSLQTLKIDKDNKKLIKKIKNKPYNKMLCFDNKFNYADKIKPLLQKKDELDKLTNFKKKRNFIKSKDECFIKHQVIINKKLLSSVNKDKEHFSLYKTQRQRSTKDLNTINSHFDFKFGIINEKK